MEQINCSHAVVDVVREEHDTEIGADSFGVTTIREKYTIGYCQTCGKRIPIPQEIENTMENDYGK